MSIAMVMKDEAMTKARECGDEPRDGDVDDKYDGVAETSSFTNLQMHGHCYLRFGVKTTKC